jgi:hypothetical protein
MEHLAAVFAGDSRRAGEKGREPEPELATKDQVITEISEEYMLLTRFLLGGYRNGA